MSQSEILKPAMHCVQHEWAGSRYTCNRPTYPAALATVALFLDTLQQPTLRNTKD